MLQPYLLQQMSKMASHSTDTSPEMSSPFVSCLIDNCMLYARPDRTQTLLQLVFQKFQKSFTVIFVYPFVANSFTDRLAPNLLTHRDFKQKCDSLRTDPFPRLASSDVDGCNGNKVSSFIKIREDCSLFVDSLYQKY